MSQSAKVHDDKIVGTILDIIQTIRDPERPENLRQLGVISEDDVEVLQRDGWLDVNVRFKPTVKHCHLAPLIGLCIRSKLQRDFTLKHKVRISLKEGSHTTEADVTKQINDKERVAAAMENKSLREIVEDCIA